MVQLKDEKWKALREREREREGVSQRILQGIMGRIFISKRKTENHMLCIIPRRIPREICDGYKLSTCTIFRGGKMGGIDEICLGLK